MSKSKQNIVLFRGEDRTEVLAYRLADSVKKELEKRGHEVKLFEIPMELTRHGKLMQGKEPDYEHDSDVEKKRFMDERVRESGDNAVGFNLHNYNLNDVPSERRTPEKLTVGSKAHTELFSDESMPELPDIFTDLIRDRVYLVEIPASYKPLPENMQERLGQTLRKYGLKPQEYEQEVVSMQECTRRRLGGSIVVGKVADLIENTPRMVREMEKEINK